ncbi:MAG: lipocalin family protein [Oceanococcaceae bacterium]
MVLGQLTRLTLVAAALMLGGCASSGSYAPLPSVAPVDLERFMGAWYVIGFIPIGGERDAHNGIEHYRLTDDDRIATVYRFRDGGFDGPLKTFTPNAKVREGTGNAEWGMQFIWPFRAEYRIAYVDPEYQHTIIARSKRDYVWLMSRQPDMDDATYADLVGRVAAMGYDMSAFRRQPQQWPEADARPPLP